MGVVNKMLRGLAMGGASPDEVYGGTREKPWIAALDAFAIGGGCQHLLVMDYVVAAERRLHDAAGAQGSRSSFRRRQFALPRFVGARIARQAIMAGRQLDCDTPEGRQLPRQNRAARRDGPASKDPAPPLPTVSHTVKRFENPGASR